MQEKKHIASLDGLRGMAAAAVVFSHLDLIFPSLAPFMITGVGGRAVAIFFALSGFLMAYLYGDRPISRKAVADFLVSRFSRIYPVYLVAVLVVAVLSSIPGFDFINPIHGGKEILRHILLLGSTGVLWSVPPEIQFYLLFPVIWLFFSDTRRYQVIGVLLAGFLALDALAGFPGPGILLISKLAFFLFGAAVGRLQPLLSERLQGTATGVLALTLPFFILISTHLFPNADNAWGLAPAFAGALAVLLVAREHRLSAAVFAAAPMRFLGKISFSLYLFHVPVMFLIGNALSSALPLYIVVPAALAAALLIAWISYECIETPARRALVSLWHQRGSKVFANPQPNTRS
ncbi:acyltransferase family protein [Rhizobium sp. Rhizsp42]|uniref:acyltransferase family protein n=1 Tax=Rhizobium sp. Rhizsp42 TaxID=3243034 RepID=UPI0039AF5DA1